MALRNNMPKAAAPAPKPNLPRMYIENCENWSEWLMLEYKHALLSWPGAVFSNVSDPKLFQALSSFVKVAAFFDDAGNDIKSGASKTAKSAVHKSSLSALKEFNPKKTIVLDPAAPKALSTADLDKAGALVVGGILGSEGFTGKTGRLLTDKLGCRARNLGKTQLSIDSAVVVCRLVALGMKLEKIKLSTELEVQHDDGHSTILPYGYPVLDGKVIFTPGLKEYLRKH
jgi:ribosome biogenesis SPOUT family RNA methylase Rps3